MSQKTHCLYLKESEIQTESHFLHCLDTCFFNVWLIIIHHSVGGISESEQHNLGVIFISWHQWQIQFMMHPNITCTEISPCFGEPEYL